MVRFVFCITVFAAALINAPAKAQAPGSDILLFDLSSKQGLLQISNRRALTNRSEYDNQPYFSADGKSLYYTAAITLSDGEQTDVIQYQLGHGSRENLTNSRHSEYSPTPMPNGLSFSTIRVDEKGKQWLWQFSPRGQSLGNLLPAVEPVGYHAWLNDHQVALFVLGEPHTLQLADTDTGASKVVDDSIGPSLFRIPGTGKISYSKQVQEQKQSYWQLNSYDPATGKIARLTRLPQGASYYAWTPDAKVIAAQGKQLLQWDSLTQHHGDDWRLFATLDAGCKGGATRLAVSPQQDTLAVVCSR